MTQKYFNCGFSASEKTTEPEISPRPETKGATVSDVNCDQVKSEKSDETTSKRTFHSARSTQQLSDMSKRKFAENSEKKISWVLDLYLQWCEYRLSDIKVPQRSKLSNLSQEKFSKEDLAYRLSHFITEVKKLNEENYPLCTLYQMMISVQMYLESQQIY